MISAEAFFDELEKISEATDDNRITKEKLRRAVRYGLAGAAGTGLGMGLGHLVGKPIEEKLVRMGAGGKASKILRYAVPTAAGLGAALAVARKKHGDEFIKHVKGEKD